MKKVITIGREFGSGGREIGRRIAEKLQIAYYDQEIVTEIAKRTKLSEDYVERITEDRPYISYPIHAGMSFHTAYYAYTEFDRSLTVFAEQHNMIKELAERSDCVIVGRCADYVLRDMDNVVKIYLYAPIRDCMRRVIRLYELNPEDAKSLIHSMNKTRGDYYQHNTGLNWSEAVHYDICLNTAGLKKEKIIDIIKNYIKTKID